MRILELIEAGLPRATLRHARRYNRNRTLNADSLVS
jgi:hypothetical protein